MAEIDIEERCRRRARAIACEKREEVARAITDALLSIGITRWCTGTRSHGRLFEEHQNYVLEVVSNHRLRDQAIPEWLDRKVHNELRSAVIKAGEDALGGEAAS